MRSSGKSGAGLLGRTLLLLALAAPSCRAPAGKTAPAVPDLDVVLVTIDTLRADSVGFLGGSRGATPNLDRLAAEGVVFTDAHAHNVLTLPSHANILTGLYPSSHGVRANEGFRLDPSFPTLATWLKSRGYATGAFVGGFPLDSRFGLARGFDIYDERYPEGPGSAEFVLPERPAADVVKAAMAWFAGAAGRPRFLWVHLYDCHVPYRPPAPYDRLFAGDAYSGEVASVDAALAPLIQLLERKSASTLLVVTSDHGEALGDHGEETHGLFAYEATLRVPLLLWSPGRLETARDTGMARHIDLAPTVLEAVGLPLPPSLPGTSLRNPPEKRGRTSYFEALSASYERGWAPLKGALGGGMKFIDLPLPELYDLGADPREARNLISQQKETARALKASFPAERGQAAPASATEEQVAKLRSLGYLAGRTEPKRSYGPEDDPKNLVGLDTALHRLVDFQAKGDLVSAMAIASELIAQRPSMPAGYEYLSALQAERGNPAAAVRTLEAAHRKNLLDERLQSRLALLSSEIGDTRRASALLEPLASSENPDVMNALGIVRARANRVPEAIAAFRAALRVHSANAAAYQNIGITCLNAGKLPEAEEALDRALALNDRLPRAWNARGVALEKRGRSEEAMASWHRAVALDGSQMDAWLNLALVAEKRGETRNQQEALRQFVARAPAALYAGDLARARKTLARLSRQR